MHCPRFSKASVPRGWVIYALLLTCVRPARADRAEARPDDGPSLNGTWQVQEVADLDTPPRADAWKTCRVPGYLHGHDYKRAWFRRTFRMHRPSAGERVKIHFGGVKFNSRVVVNGTRVGGCFGGYRSFEVDVTDALRDDGANELLVGVHDWTGLFTPGPRVDFGNAADWQAVRGSPRDRILAPIGGLFGLYGIWDDVEVRVVPAVRIDGVFVQPSVRRKTLTVVYTLVNETGRAADVTLSATVSASGRKGLVLPSRSVRIPASGSAEVTLSKPWARPVLWSPARPYQYTLHSEVRRSDGSEIVRGGQRTRFGFREFWTDGPHFVLNGTRINLLATSWWPPHEPMSRDEIRRRWQAVKDMGCVAFRTHTQPWRSVHYEVADELGLLMIPEGAVWNDDYVYRILDKRFWDNYATHLRAMVRRYGNHPSVVMWSLENEMYGGRLNDASGAKADLIRMGRVVKQADPTRPILYESDGDPGGAADVIGIHYPHEYPQYTCWPNEITWLRKPHPFPSMFHNGQKQFVWKRDKPLYVGEFLWLPSRDPSWHTVFFGDEAYRDYRRYRNLGKAAAWRMQILGYRHMGVAGISPWTVIEGGPLEAGKNPLFDAQCYACQKQAAYCLDFDSRFYAGQKIPRRLDVYNDTPASADLDVQWDLIVGEKPVDSGRTLVSLPPAGRKTITATLTMPKVTHRTPAQWRVRVLCAGKQVFGDRHGYSLFPPPRLGEISAALVVYDPGGKAWALLKSQGLNARRIDSLAGLAEASPGVLVIGPGALADKDDSPGRVAIGQVSPVRKQMTDFFRRGGRALVLAQTGGLAGLLDVPLTDRGATMTFPLRPRHPVLAGVEARDLKFWRGDHMAATRLLARPVAGAGRAIVVSGSASGLDAAVLMEYPLERGLALLCQMPLCDKFATEPAAGRILDNALRYLATWRPSPGGALVLSGGPEYVTFLEQLGLRGAVPAGKIAAGDPAQCPLVIARGPVAARYHKALREFVRRGGHLLLHRTPAEGWDELMAALDVPLTRQLHTGPVTRCEQVPAELAGLTREDLYWLGEHRGHGWATTPRAREMADATFGAKLDPAKATKHLLAVWERSGKIVRVEKDEVVFATVGQIKGRITFPAPGEYVFGVLARGTPCDGLWPRLALRIDDKPAGEVTVASRTQSLCTITTRVARKGQHAVAIAYVNDGSNADRGEDRNVWVEELLVARHDPAGVTYLPTPPAMALVRRGKGLILVDQVRWDTEADNARKAARLARAVLGGLGARLSAGPRWAVEAETMTPQEGMGHFQRMGTTVTMACSGYIAKAVTVVKAGRYRLELVARGTPAEGVFPIVRISLGAKTLGEIKLTSGAWRTYSLGVDLPAGRAEFRVAFTNDRNVAGEDRNLYVDKVVFTRP